jgi:hypothetical protein
LGAAQARSRSDLLKDPISKIHAPAGFGSHRRYI